MEKDYEKDNSSKMIIEELNRVSNEVKDAMTQLDNIEYVELRSIYENKIYSKKYSDIESKKE